MKAQRGSSSIALLIHNLGYIWGGGQRHALAALPLVKSPGTHDTGGWVGPGPIWTGVKKSKSRTPRGVRTPYRPAHSELLYGLQS